MVTDQKAQADAYMERLRESDMEAGKIPRMFAVHPGDQRFRGEAVLFGAQHDRRAVRVGGADVPALVAGHFLEAHPDVGLDVLDQMAKMNGAVGVGQGRGDKDFARHGVMWL